MRLWLRAYESTAYIKAEYDGDFKRVAALPLLNQANGGEATTKWLRAGLNEAMVQDGLTLRIIEPAATPTENQA